MADKETLALIETLKANNEELLKQVALLTEQVAYLTNKLYGKSSEKIDPKINTARDRELY